MRYVTSRDDISDVTRATLHPIWQVLTVHLAELPESSEPILPEARALEILRQQRSDMAIKQAFGNLPNVLVLNGTSPEDIAQNFSEYAAMSASTYTNDIGHAMLQKKVEEITARLSPLIAKHS